MSFYYDLDGARRIDNVVVAVHQVITFDGLLGLGLRRVAKTAGMSPASLNQHYGTWAHVLERVARQTARSRHLHLTSRIRYRGLVGYLPEAPIELASMRVWLALMAIGSGLPAMGAALTDRTHLAVLPHDSSRHADGDLVELLRVFGEGICAALNRPVDPLSTERARALVRLFEQAFDLP